MKRANSCLVAVLIAAACSGGGGKPTTPTPPVPADAPAPTPADAPVAIAPIDAPVAIVEPPPPADQAPEWFEPKLKKVGVGQKVSFGIEAIDQDLDETEVKLVKAPKSAKYDPITLTVAWTPVKGDIGKQDFEVSIATIGNPAKAYKETRTFSIEVTKEKQVLPVAEQRDAVTETLLMIRQPGRLEQVNKDWPLDKLLLHAAVGFKWQFSAANREKLDGKPLDKKKLFNQFLQTFSVGQNNPRLDPGSKQFDKAAFGNPASWKIVAFRPRIDRQWTELRVVYQAVNAPEPVFAMWRIRPVVEYVPALPRPEEEHVYNNKTFLGMVSKHLMKDGGPNEAFLSDQKAHGKAVAALMNELLNHDDSKAGDYKRGFAIGIAAEARMGGGTKRDAKNAYVSGDGWGWHIMKPFQTQDAKTQMWTNPTIPGFWTFTVPSADGKRWEPKCSPRFTKGDPKAMPGYEVLCRPTLGFVDLPDTNADGKIVQSRREATNLFIEHKQKYVTEHMTLDDPRRDNGEENGMTCAQCHIRNFGMHDYSDLAATDPSKGLPKTKNHKLQTLNFIIIPTTHWEEFTLEFLKHQECRAKENFEEFGGGAAAHKGLTCKLIK